MFILGLQGSPRIRGNTRDLLSAFLDQAGRAGAQTRLLDVARMNITPCLGCGKCEKKGFCVIANDDMATTIYPLLRRADVVVAATPIYFYHASAQLKVLIDRTQALWSRKYRFKLDDPGKKWRQGVLMSVAASAGANLFDGLELSARYFFDAVGADYAHALTYRNIEHPGDMRAHERLLADLQGLVDAIVTPLAQRQKVMFIDKRNACGSQAAAAFARYLAGDRIEAISCGIEPANAIDADMQVAMAEKQMDMAFLSPQSVDDGLIHMACPDRIVYLGPIAPLPGIGGARVEQWRECDLESDDIGHVRRLCAKIESRVCAWIQSIH
jgi:arsenate reductase